MSTATTTATSRWWRPVGPSLWWRPLERSDRTALWLIVALPVALFTLPALFGHPALAQDNLIQNFPLRVLTGQQLRSGHLPLLNPLANSGTPLLGGMNAGSFFPPTLLFVVLPSILAWVLNLVAVYVVAALGVFALLRWHGVSTWAAFVPALTYAYSGAMLGQLVHLGVVQGYALLPWMVLMLLALATAVEREPEGVPWRSSVRAVTPHVVGLCVLWALTSLSGEPRAIAEMELLTLIVVPVVLMVRSSFQPSSLRRRLTYVACIGVGIGWGALAGLAQLITGWSFINVSQRVRLTYSFWGAGSLPVRWSSLLFIPDIFGGNGLAHQPTYFVNYNLPEVTGYVGVLAMVATAGFLAQCTRRGWRRRHREYVVYVALLVVGLFATWGDFTPLGHLFESLPLFGSTRLQSRNVVLVDLAMTVLLGWWLQRLVERDIGGAGLRGRRRWITLSPAVVTAGLCVIMLVAGGWFTRFLAATPSQSVLAHYEAPTLVAHLAVAVAVIALLVRCAVVRRLIKWLFVVTALDMVLFVVFCSTGFLPGNVSAMPSRASAVAQLGSQGRFALVDPSGAHQADFENLGSPNMNVFTGLASVQGYGSLVNALYGNVTASHPLFSLNPCQLADGTFRQLRLSAIAVSTRELATPLYVGERTSPRCLALVSVTKAQRYFGQLLPVRVIRVVGANGRPAAKGPVSAQLLDSFGRPFGPVVSEIAHPTTSFYFGAYGEVAAGVELHSNLGMVISSTIVVQLGAKAPSFRLNTPFQQALSTPAWQIERTTGSMTIFRATSVRPSAWLGTNATTSRITKVRNASWGDSWVSVVATHPTVLKRSTEWIPGWRATAVNDRTGRSTTLHVVRSGLIQQVTVPPGSWTVHFHYHAPHIELGLIGSGLGVLVLCAVSGYVWIWVPRKRTGKVRA